MSAILFGSIGTIADTSELQRQAFNQAFGAHNLDWQWSQNDYRAMLDKSGGEDRIAAYADSVGESVDAPSIHRSKSEFFQKSLGESQISARPGVVETIEGAKDKGSRVALVTTTSEENIQALLQALRPTIQKSDFDLVVDASSVGQPKPDAAAYTFALQTLGQDARDCVAIEDNVGGVQAAAAAGVRCVAFPGENNAGHSFESAEAVVDRLDPAALFELIPGA